MLRLAIAILLAGSAAAAASPVYLALPLDRAGKLDEALPLYAARAAETLTTTDRLRHAGALLRAGRPDEARSLYDALVAEKGSIAHGDAEARMVMTCASSLLLQGFPGMAVEYLRAPVAARPASRALGLLFARALVAAGDPAAARVALARIDPAGAARWEVGERIELARVRLATGEPQLARALLEDVGDGGVAALFRDGLLGEMALRNRDWTRAASILREASQRVPASLSEPRVDSAWRNAQRELRGVQVRHALALWNLGMREAAAAEAARGAETDEEAVRSGALVLRSAADLAEGRTEAALARLTALGGHDRRFAGAVARLTADLAAGADTAGDATAVATALREQDRASDHVAAALADVLADAAAASRRDTGVGEHSPTPDR
jgi:hypothetical protein